MVQVRVRFEHRLAGADTVPGGHQSGHLRQQTDGPLQADIAVHGIAVLLGHGQQRHARLEHIHGPGILGPVTHALQHVRRHLTHAFDLTGKILPAVRLWAGCRTAAKRRFP
jgi:hypothetical protein